MVEELTDNKIDDIQSEINECPKPKVLSNENLDTTRQRLNNTFSTLSLDEKIHFKNIDSLKEKLITFYNETPRKMMVITDFDRTLSSFTSKTGAHSPTSYEVVLSCKPEVYKLAEKEKSLREKYIKIEFSTTLTYEEKIPYMIEWWQKANELIFDAGLCEEHIKTVSIDTSLVLRDGFCQIIERCTSNEVIVVIASAGIGDVILEKMTQELESLKNVKIISNFFTYDSNNIVVGFQGPIIHSFNKNIIFELETPFFLKNKERSNILLFGDSVGDIAMIQDFPWPLQIIKIGFINFDLKAHLDQYLAKYDIVVEDPSSAESLIPLIQFLFP